MYSLVLCPEYFLSPAPPYYLFENRTHLVFGCIFVVMWVHVRPSVCLVLIIMFNCVNNETSNMAERTFINDHAHVTQPFCTLCCCIDRQI